MEKKWFNLLIIKILFICNVIVYFKTIFYKNYYILVKKFYFFDDINSNLLIFNFIDR